MNRAFRNIITSFILLLVCTTLVFFAMGDETANAWTPPGLFGPGNMNTLDNKYAFPQQTFIPVYDEIGTYTAEGFNFGADHWDNEILETDRWQARSTNEIYAVYMMTAHISDELYYALMRGVISLETNASAVFENNRVALNAPKVELGMKSFLSIGSIIGTGLEWDSFSAISETSGEPENRSISAGGSSVAVNTSAKLNLNPMEARYIRYGISLRAWCDSTLWTTNRALIRNINFSLTVSADDYHVGNVSSSENAEDFMLRDDINAYNRNQGDLYGKDFGTIAGNSDYGVMTGSNDNGSMLPIEPEITTISTQYGTAPTMKDVVIGAGSYNNGVFIPNSPTVSLPTFTSTNISDLVIPNIKGIDNIQAVQERNVTYSIPNPSPAALAPPTGSINIDTFEAKEPADPYRWKDPLELDPSLSQEVDYNYKSSYDPLVYYKHFYDIYSSGTIFRSMDHATKAGGRIWYDEVQIKFHTNDQDMHIVVAPGVNIKWRGDKDSRMEIIGKGRVFLYLMRNNHFYMNADIWTAGEAGNFIGTTNREDNPRLFIIGIGGNINLEFLKINARTAIYMPHGRTAKYNPGANSVKFVANSHSHEVNGIVVADLIEFGVESDGKFTFYRRYDDKEKRYRSGLPDNIYFNGNNRPLSYFMQDPAAESNYTNYKWYNTGTYYN